MRLPGNPARRGRALARLRGELRAGGGVVAVALALPNALPPTGGAEEDSPRVASSPLVRERPPAAGAWAEESSASPCARRPVAGGSVLSFPSVREVSYWRPRFARGRPARFAPSDLARLLRPGSTKACHVM